jgi:hypothetical protein
MIDELQDEDEVDEDEKDEDEGEVDEDEKDEDEIGMLSSTRETIGWTAE